MKLLVLWDIDGTLVDAGGFGAAAFRDAFAAVIGRPPERLPEMAGRTDLAIALDVLAHNGVPDGEAHLPAFADALAVALAAREGDIRAHGRALPGAHEAMEALAGIDDVLQSLLTGNIEPNAHVKLAAFGLERHLDFGVGAFGSDERHRPLLVGIARAKARARHGLEFTREETVLIGDTPRDVAAGREGGARVVAVATGRYDEAALADAGADVVLPGLEDTAAVLAAVGAAPPAYAS